MDRSERFYLIDQLLQARRVVPLTIMLDELQVSRATVKRDLEYMRDRLNAPIVWDRTQRGYCYDTAQPGAGKFALPGVWFNASELHALLTMEHLLSNLQPGLLGPQIAPLKARIRALLDTGDHSADEVVKRIKLLQMAARPVTPSRFEEVAHAILARTRIRITHHNRNSDVHTEREVSPQRLVYYRDNWYLDAWCHLRDGLRSFGVDAITSVQPLPAKARSVGEKMMNAELGDGYGIFAGTKTRLATLRFTPARARWVANEQWHPQQQGAFNEDGSYELTLPYANSTELVMDILRHGAEVEVLKPAALRRQVAGELAKAGAQYAD